MEARVGISATSGDLPDGETTDVVIDLHGYMVGAATRPAVIDLESFGDGRVRHDHTAGQRRPRFVTWDTADSADVKFFGYLLDHVEQALCVDTRRVFVAGYSQGAFLASSLVCLYADRIAAVAAVAGIRDGAPGCRPTQRSTVVVHGTADLDIVYTGGLGPSASGNPVLVRRFGPDDGR